MILRLIVLSAVLILSPMVVYAQFIGIRIGNPQLHYTAANGSTPDGSLLYQSDTLLYQGDTITYVP